MHQLLGGLARFHGIKIALAAVALSLMIVVQSAQASEEIANTDPAILLLSELVVTPTGGEFIEIYNPGSTAVDLSDVYLTDATFADNDAYYFNIVTGANAGGGGFSDFHARFPDGASIGPAEYQTIALAGSDVFSATYGVVPTYELYEENDPADAILDMREALPGSIDDQGGLTNGGEVVVLYYWDGESDLVTDLDYALWGDKAEAVDKTDVSVDGPDADSDETAYLADTAIAGQDVIATGSHAGGTSWMRQDLDEGIELKTVGNGAEGHDETSENLSETWCTGEPTPNEESNCAASAVRIHEIQGSGDRVTGAGPYVVNAVVVGDFQGEAGVDDQKLDGFFVQEEDSDADVDPATSEGIFVFCGSCPVDVMVGDSVAITGTASDFFGMSQIGAPTPESVSVLSSGNALPSPSVLTLPVPDVTAVEYPAATEQIDAYYEPFEGMLVTISGTLAVSEYFQLSRFGQLVLSQGQRPRQYTDTNQPDPVGYTLHQIDLDASRLILDDDSNQQNHALGEETSESDDIPVYHPIPGFSVDNFVRGGDTISDLTGVLHWSWAGSRGTDAWRIRPVPEAFDYTFVPANPRSSLPEDVGGSFKVASFNVLNYFTTLDDGTLICGPSDDMDCRGANSAAELQRQTDKIVAALCAMDADVVGLMEIENNAQASLMALVDGVNAVCGPYAYVETGTIGTDAIKVGLIYKTDTAMPVGTHQILDASVDADFVDTRNRPVLAQTFVQTRTGGQLTVAVNHLKSKGSDCDDLEDPDLNDGQGNCNLTRTRAAQALATWLATDPTGSGDADFLIIGDLNAYRNEDPVVALETAGFTDLLDRFGGADAYGYVFDGQLGYLDHALANPSLLPQVTGATAWHINADEVNLLDYNDPEVDNGEASFEAKPGALPLYSPDPYRASDHDPVVVGLDLVVAQVSISQKAVPQVVRPGHATSFILSVENSGDLAATDVTIRDTIPAEFQVTGIVVDGVALSLESSGVDYRWSARTLAPGASTTVTISGLLDANVGQRVTITNTATVSARNDADPTDDVAHAVLLTPPLARDPDFMVPIGGVELGGAEIAAYDPTSRKLFVTTGDGLQVVDLTDPTAPQAMGWFTPTKDGFNSDAITSVAVNQNGIVAVALPDADESLPGDVLFYDTDGTLLGSAEVGALPDMLTFNVAETWVLVANEGEPGDDTDPEGSVSIVDISGGVADATVITADFNDFNGEVQALSSAGVRLFPEVISGTLTLARDLEPEYIAVDPSGRKALVTLQENNAVAVLNLLERSITAILPLGTKDHSLPSNRLDASDRDGRVSLQTWPVHGLYMPDAIASFLGTDEEPYWVTANEGDDRGDADEDARGDAIRLKDLADVTSFGRNGLALEPGIDPGLLVDERLGRLAISSIDGDTDGDGELDQLFSYGARSFSIWNANGDLIYDSGMDIGLITADQTPDLFNANDGDPDEFDTRSDNKGAEPEGVTTGQVSGRTYAFVGLERAGGGVLVYDVTDPAAPTFVQYARVPEDVSPEGMLFIPRDESPIHQPLLVVANEISNTVRVYQIDENLVYLPVISR